MNNIHKNKFTIILIILLSIYVGLLYKVKDVKFILLGYVIVLIILLYDIYDVITKKEYKTTILIVLIDITMLIAFIALFLVTREFEYMSLNEFLDKSDLIYGSLIFISISGAISKILKWDRFRRL